MVMTPRTRPDTHGDPGGWVRGQRFTPEMRKAAELAPPRPPPTGAGEPPGVGCNHRAVRGTPRTPRHPAGGACHHKWPRPPPAPARKRAEQVGGEAYVLRGDRGVRRTGTQIRLGQIGSNRTETVRTARRGAAS